MVVLATPIEYYRLLCHPSRPAACKRQAQEAALTRRRSMTFWLGFIILTLVSGLVALSSDEIRKGDKPCNYPLWRKVNRISTWMFFILLVFLVGSLVEGKRLNGQEDLQNRTVGKVSVDISSDLYLVGYSISNFRTQSPQNTNIFAGVGYRSGAWWLEGMFQKQWSASGGPAYSFGKHWGWDLTAAAVYRFSPTGPNEARLYLNASRRFDLRKLWSGWK
jgi:hypothetical protein